MITITATINTITNYYGLWASVQNASTRRIRTRNRRRRNEQEKEYEKKMKKKEYGEHKDTNRGSLLHPRSNVELDVERVINTRRRGVRAEGGEDEEQVASERTKLTSYLTTTTTIAWPKIRRTPKKVLADFRHKFSSQMCYTFIVRVSLL